jgi:hypothetical protein
MNPSADLELKDRVKYGVGGLGGVVLAGLLALAFAEPIPLYDHSFRSFDDVGYYRLTTPRVSPLWDVHNVSLRFSNRYYYSDDTSLVANRWLLHFADSINFHDIDFNFRIRLDAPGRRVRDAGWTSERAGAANDPGFVYDPDRIVAHYSPGERFRFGFGKDRYNWGPLELGGLLLSDYNEGFTGLYQRYRLGPFVLRGLAAQLNSMTTEPLDLSRITHRYFSASRLEYYRPNHGFAVSQSMLYVGIGRSWDIRYLFPFYIFHYGQMTESHGYGNDGQNSQGAIDGYWKIHRLPLEIYGELLVDDFQAHSDTLSRTVQNCVAWMVGLRLRDAGGWYGFIEGGRINTYVYNHRITAKQYTYNGNFIGSPLGPDQELLWGKIGRRFNIYEDTLAADVNFWLRRSGERGIEHRFPDIFNTKGDPIPYGTIEDELSFWAAAAYRKSNVRAEIRAGATMYRNRGNEPSDWTAYPFVGVFLSSGISISAASPPASAPAPGQPSPTPAF